MSGVLVQILENPNFPDKWPFSSSDFERFDESSDTGFYVQPRFVTHIDDGAIKALTKYVGAVVMRAPVHRL